MLMSAIAVGAARTAAPIVIPVIVTARAMRFMPFLSLWCVHALLSAHATLSREHMRANQSALPGRSKSVTRKHSYVDRKRPAKMADRYVYAGSRVFDVSRAMSEVPEWQETPARGERAGDSGDPVRGGSLRRRRG